MDLDELAIDPTSKVWKPPVATIPAERPILPFPNHSFWMIGDDGRARKMTSTEDGRIIPVDPYGL